MIDNGESTAENYGYYSDSDLEDDGDENPNQSVRARDESSAGPSRQPHCEVGEEPCHEKHIELVKKGKVVRIPDIAFVT